MPRIARIAPGGAIFHIINRAEGKLKLFRKDRDFETFLDVLTAAQAHHPLQIFGWCLLNDSWHMVVRPKKTGDLSRFVGYLTLTHSARWQVANKAAGAGKLYQGRFKNFMIQEDEHLLSVLRYVESASMQKKLATRATDWQWTSFSARTAAAKKDSREALLKSLLTDWPVQQPRDWKQSLNRPQPEAEVAAIELCIKRGRPYGDDAWLKRTVARYDLQSTIRPRGRQVGWRKVKATKKK